MGGLGEQGVNRAVVSLPAVIIMVIRVITAIVIHIKKCAVFH